MDRDLAATRGRGDFEPALTPDDRLELRVWLRLLVPHAHGALDQPHLPPLPRFDLMAQLDRAPGGLTMGQLSRRLMVSNGNVTGLIDRLLGEGLVARRPAPDDRRAQMVRLTAKGKRAFDRMTPAHQAWIEELFAGLGRREMAKLHDGLGRMKISLAGNGTETDDGKRKE